MNQQSKIEEEDYSNSHKVEIEEPQSQNKQVIDDEEDDWNPLPPKKENTILNKFKVKFTNQEIKQQGEENFRDVKFDKGEFLDFDENELDEDNIQKGKTNINNLANKVNKDQIDHQNMDFDEEDVEVDAGNKLFHDNKKAIKKLRDQIQNEDVFFNPIEDEEDDIWVKQNFKPDSQQGNIVLSCPSCFVQLCYDAQRHAFYDNQYRSVFVKNVKINTTKIIQPTVEEEEKNQGFQNKNRFRKNKRKNKKNQQEQQNNDLVIHENDNLENENLEELEKKIDQQKDSFMIYFSSECAYCSTEVAAYELNEKVYHFFNVIPSLG